MPGVEEPSTPTILLVLVCWWLLTADRVDVEEDADDEIVAVLICVVVPDLSSMLDWVNCVVDDEAEVEEENDVDDEEEVDDACACCMFPVEVDVANCDAAIVSRFNAADCVKSCNFLICCKNNN